MEAKPKAKKGRPRKTLDTKGFEFFQEREWQRALQDRKVWEEQYEKTKAITGADFETFEEFEENLRSKHPDLAALAIDQLYILEGIDRIVIKSAYMELERITKAPIDKESYTLHIPSERVNEYSLYLTIANCFNNIRDQYKTRLPIPQVQEITANRVVFNHQTLKLEVNGAYFCKEYETLTT